MRVAVQRLYAAGQRVRPDAREHWGELEIQRRGMALVAMLLHLQGNRSVEQLPPLYDVHLVRLCGEVIELRGYENSQGWHLQTWSCRRPTHHEIALASMHGDAIDPDYPRFLRWWSQLLEYANNRPAPEALVQVDEILRQLDIRLEDGLRFIEWLGESGRAYNTPAGSALGSIALKARRPEG